MTSYPVITGREIRAFRRARNLSQADLAGLLDVHQVTVSDWERGHTQPSAGSCRRLLALGCLPAPNAPPVIRGESIRAWRHERGMTQRELAEALGIHPSTVSTWEVGGHTPKPASCRDLAALGVPSDTESSAPPSDRPRTCSECPQRPDCVKLRDLALWCLCEHKPPLAADLLLALQVDAAHERPSPAELKRALDQIPDPIRSSSCQKTSSPSSTT